VVLNRGRASFDRFFVAWLSSPSPTTSPHDVSLTHLPSLNRYPSPQRDDPDGYDVLFVDAAFKGSFASRVSHSCTPNCQVSNRRAPIT
jgi:hypothetical protein